MDQHSNQTIEMPQSYDMQTDDLFDMLVGQSSEDKDLIMKIIFQVLNLIQYFTNVYKINFSVMLE
jgi:hypothetical protein